jgi:hypothetical protein
VGIIAIAIFPVVPVKKLNIGSIVRKLIPFKNVSPSILFREKVTIVNAEMGAIRAIKMEIKTMYVKERCRLEIARITKEVKNPKMMVNIIL